MTAAPVSAETGKAYFDGKTIEWIIATAPGGGHDFYARMIGRHMERYLPGSTIVMKNRPGAGHIIGANLVYNANPNGRTIGSYSTGLVYSQVLGKKGIQFDLSKMSWIGKAASDTRVLSASVKSDYKSFEDVLKVTEPVKFSASGVGAGSYNDAFLTATAFGFPFRIITGYSGNETVLGMMRGETDLLMGGLSSAETYVRAGQVRLLLQFGTRVPGVPNARDYAQNPDAKAIVNLLIAQGNLARVTSGPPGIPADRLEALRTAYREAVTDKTLLEESAKAQREFDPAYGDEVRQMVLEALDQPPRVVAILKELANVKVDMIQHVGPVTKIENEGRVIHIDNSGDAVSAKVSGSRTTLTIDTKNDKRKNVKVGMICTFTYPGPGKEAKRIDCKN